MELKQYFGVIKRWWWLLLASTLVATVFGYLAVSHAPRIYQATTTVRVGQAMESPNPSPQEFSISQQLAQTYMNMVTRRPILEGAAETLDLSYVPWAQNISARVVPGTQLLEISVRDTNPQRARALADAIAQQLISQTPNEIAKDQARQDFVQSLLTSLEEKIQATEDEIQVEQDRLDTANSARAIQQYQNNLDALQQKLANYQSTYASLLQSVEGRTNIITIIEKAGTPTQPISPRVPETVLMAAAIGLVFALGGAFLIEFTDDSVKTPEDMKQITDRPLLASILCFRGQNSDRRLILLEQPHSPISESYRALRTNIQFLSVDKPIHTLVVTSASQLEGKSTTAANLAVAIAQTGRSVVLVDTDLRRSVQHETFQVSNEQGLTSALLQEEPTLDEYLYETGIENLRLLTSGPLPPSPSELLGSKKMQRLIGLLKESAELVIFDTPPALLVTDAAVLATQVDSVVVVAEAGRTRRAAVRQTEENLRQVGAKVLGTVLNRLSPRHSGVYGSEYYYAKKPEDRQQKPKGRWYQRIPLVGRLLPS